MNSKEREDKKEIKVIKEMEDWGRHFDILLWTVTTIMAAAIGGLLVCTTNKFDIGLAIAGFFLTIIAVYFAASFREVRHKVGEHYSAELKEVLRSRKLSQWGAYRLIFAILAILYTKLLIENSNNSWLIWLWFIMGSIGTVRIMLLKYEEKRNGGSMGLKNNILATIKEIESNKIFPETIRKQVPMLLLFIKTNASLEEMKKVINELVNEKRILFFTNDLTTRITKSINQSPPTREALLEQPTEDELFVCGCVINISE